MSHFSTPKFCNNRQNTLSPTAFQSGPIFALLIGLIYVFDQRLNALVSANILGSLLYVSFALAFSFYRISSVNLFNIKTLAILCLLSLYSLLSYSLNTSCSIQYKGAFSLLLLWLVVPTLRISSLAVILMSHVTSMMMLLLIITFIVLDYARLPVFLDVMNAGVFNEASHVAIYVLPLLSYRILKSYKDPLASAVLVIILVCSPSTTLIVGMLFLFSVSYLKSRIHKPILSLFFVVIIIGTFLFVVMSGIIAMPDTQRRIENLFTGHQATQATAVNMSSLVWLNGWSQAFQSLTGTNGFGLGFNQMGCGMYSEVGIYTPLIQEAWSGDMLNSEDGSLLAAKLIAEFGFLGIVIVAIFTWQSVTVLFKFIRSHAVNRNSESQFSLMRATGAISLLVYLFVRSGPYFQLPVILAISLLLFSKNNLRDNNDPR